MLKYAIIAFLLLASNRISAQETAHVYFLRSSGIDASLTGFRIFDGNEQICKLNNDCFSEHNLAAGQHSISVSMFTKSPSGFQKKYVFDLEAGKEYYFKICIATDYLKTILSVNDISKTEAEMLMKKLKRDKSCR